jgi:hypothetical protein
MWITCTEGTVSPVQIPIADAAPQESATVRWHSG